MAAKNKSQDKRLLRQDDAHTDGRKNMNGEANPSPFLCALEKSGRDGRRLQKTRYPRTNYL
ncbi:hypothetical protein GCM10027398_35780 [Azotobacter salinestris]